jgi:uncharacterized protein (TIGR02996 family)
MILDHPEELLHWLVYADWLDERGDPRSEFLRLSVERRELPPGDAVAGAIDARLAVLRDTLDPNWMLVFDTARLANCRESGWPGVCRHRTWDRLAPTDEPDIRICHQCKSPVFYCHTAEEARAFASCGQCVALSSRAAPAQSTDELVALVPPRPADYAVPEEEVVIELDELTEYGAVVPRVGNRPPPRRRPWWRFW